MQKRLLMLFMIVTIVCLAGCAKKGQNDLMPNNPDNNPIESSGEIANDDVSTEESVIAEEIKDYEGVFVNIALYVDSASGDDHNEFGVSSLLAHLKGDKNPYASFSYILKDLNADGVEELLLFDNKATEDKKNIIISMYTLKDGDVYHILNSHVDNYFKLCEDNVIKNEAVYENEEYENYYNLTKENSLEFIEMGNESSGDTPTSYDEAELVLKPVK